jgi:hypothetical protein
MTLNAANFLHSLCLWLETATGLKYQTTPRQLWRTAGVEGTDCADPYAVVRIYGGSAGYDPTEVLSVQVMAQGTGAEAVMALSRKLFEAATNVDGTPVQGRTITGKTTAGAADGTWRLASIIPMQRPTVLGVDDLGRCEISFNWEIVVSR